MAATGKPSETSTRFRALCKHLVENGQDGAVLDSRNDLFYFTGYTGSDSVLVISAKKRKGWLVTDARYTEEAELTAPEMETTLWRDGFARFTGDLLKKNGMKKVACTPATLTVDFFSRMKRASGGADIRHDAGTAIADLRAVKSASELKAMAKALDCAQKAFTASRAHWKIGMTEVEVKNDLEWEMKKRGAEDAAFETIVAVGANASISHAHAGKRKIAAGKMLLVDFGARLNRYNSDLTRTVWPRDIPKVWLKRYETVLGAQRAGIAAIRAGVTGVEVDKAARAVLADAGLEGNFIHGLGHAIGLAVHENPRLSKLYDRPLVAGNVVTVEPGVYFPGSGGIRTEDMVVVEKGGARVLSSLPREAKYVVI